MTGQELREWRLGHDYTQAELAAQLGVSRLSLVKWEDGSTAAPSMLALALKGLLFTHAEGKCRCARCGGTPDRYSAAANRVYDPTTRHDPNGKAQCKRNRRG